MRYVYILIFICFAVIGCGYFAERYVEDKLVSIVAERNANNLTDSFLKVIWRKYSFMFDLINDDVEKLPYVPQYSRFISDINSFFENSGVEQVKLHSKNNTLFYQRYDLESNYGRGIFQHNNVIIYNSAVAGEIIASVAVDYGAENALLMDFTYNMSKFMQWTNDIYIAFISIVVAILLIVALIIYRMSYLLQREVKEQYEINARLKSAKVVAEEQSINKSKFLANITHELRTPLNSIIGFSQMIKNGSLEEEQYINYAVDIHESGEHLLSLINDILDFSKSEANRLEVDFTWFDLARIIEICYRMMLPRAENAGVILEKNVDQANLAMQGDPRRIKQVIINLLSNAIKFTKTGGKVLIFAVVNDGQLIIKVVDNGIGIAEEDIGHVMGTFGQVESDLSRQYEGTGLGLPLTKNLVELMHGEFELESTVGSGTTVILRFAHREYDIDG